MFAFHDRWMCGIMPFLWFGWWKLYILWFWWCTDKKDFSFWGCLCILITNLFFFFDMIKSLEVTHLKADIFCCMMSKKLSLASRLFHFELVLLLCYISCTSLLFLVCFGLFLMGKGIKDIIDLMLLVFEVVCSICGLLQVN